MNEYDKWTGNTYATMIRQLWNADNRRHPFTVRIAASFRLLQHWIRRPPGLWSRNVGGQQRITLLSTGNGTVLPITDGKAAA